MRNLFQSLSALRHLAIGGSLVGLGTGLFWSLVVSIFSLDQLFNGTELLLSLAVPGIISVTIWKILKIRFWIVLPIAYLTLLLPLFGLGIGGANTLQMTIGGILGGGLGVSDGELHGQGGVEVLFLGFSIEFGVTINGFSLNVNTFWIYFDIDR